jgi:CSLREA domain-containing protein
MRWSVAGVVGLACVSLTAGAAAQGGRTFVVDTVVDAPDSSVADGLCAAASGGCTLRAAIQEANATAELDTIAFAIGSGPQRIELISDLPAANHPVLIDGWSQPGFSGTPLIEVRGSMSVGTGFSILGGSSTLRGLVINGFGGDGVLLALGNGNALEGNYIGLDATGTSAVRNQGAGVRIESAENRIGGLTLAQRNVISGNGSLGIDGGVLIYGNAATKNFVQGNFIGLDATGIEPVPNLGRGVAIHYASNNQVGGSAPGAGNLIAGNRATGVRVMAQSSGNVIQRNWIGVNKLGELRVGLWPEDGVLSNARGVHLRGDRNYVVENIIAGNSWDGVLFYNGVGKDLVPEGYPSDNIVYGNVIVGNGQNGIGAYVGTRNRIIGNHVFANVGLGIELANVLSDVVTLNDAEDGDEGTNDLQNYPTLVGATVSGGQTTVTGALESGSDASYTVEFFATPGCSSSGHGQGAYPVGRFAVTTDASGVGNFELVLPVGIPAGWVVTATATNPAGSTSEFSACVPVS